MAISVLLVDDEATFRDLVERKLRREGFMVEACGDGAEAVRLIQQHRFDVVLLDLCLPGMDGIACLREIKARAPALEVVVLTGHASVESAIAAMKMGAYDFLEKPLRFAKVTRAIENAYERGQLKQENKVLRAECLWRDLPATDLLGDSAAIKSVVSLAERVAASGTSVLIEGESGVGKELVARLIHRRSQRQDQPFLVINCGAMHDGLLENELFGHAAGAFTGASGARAGIFDVVNGGTLFIDEVGEMSLETQKKFLRVLENGDYMRLGETVVRHCDVRIIAATNKRMGEEVRSGRFREDLFYRLSVINIHVPPLRERAGDIPLLVQHFLDQLKAVKRVADEVLVALQRYRFPGNVRELRNLIERAVILSDGDDISWQDFPPIFGADAVAPPTATPTTGRTDAVTPLVELEKCEIMKALEQAHGHRTRAARLLGISLRSLYRKLQKHGLETQVGSALGP
jgi:DNA-binding NtrC family response regulator